MSVSRGSRMCRILGTGLAETVRCITPSIITLVKSCFRCWAVLGKRDRDQPLWPSNVRKVVSRAVELRCNNTHAQGAVNYDTEKRVSQKWIYPQTPSNRWCPMEVAKWLIMKGENWLTILVRETGPADPHTRTPQPAMRSKLGGALGPPVTPSVYSTV